MSVTYPPELLPIASPDDEAEVIVCDGDEQYRISESCLRYGQRNDLLVDSDTCAPAAPACRRLH
jgi:hypothetical protein